MAQCLPSFLPDGRARSKMRRLNSTVNAVKRMSHWRVSVLAGVAISVAAAASSFAQTSITPTLRTTERDGRIVVSEQQAADFGINPNVGPTAIDRQNLSEAVKSRVQRFELSRDAYLREQEQLRKRLSGATTEGERERVRALIREQRVEWLRRMRELRAQSKDRIAELRRQLPSKGEVLDAARENARDAIQEIRKRRGQD
jgi:hypothetical protein